MRNEPLTLTTPRLISPLIVKSKFPSESRKPFACTRNRNISSSRLLSETRQPLADTNISKSASSLMISRTEAVPKRRRRNEFAWTPWRAALVVLSSKVPPASILKTAKFAARLMSRISTSPGLESVNTPANPYALKLMASVPMLKLSPNSRVKPASEILISAKPLPDANPRNSTLPSMRILRPFSTVIPAMVWTVLVVFKYRAALASKPMPRSSPKPALRESSAARTRPWSSRRSPPATSSEPNGSRASLASISISNNSGEIWNLN